MTHRPAILSIDALLFTLLVGAYVPLRFILLLPQLVPGQPALTATLLLGVGVYWLIDLIGAQKDPAPRWVNRGKWLLIALAITLITIGPLLMIVFVRHQSVPYQYAHDGLIQNEIAVRFVLDGKNPYVENYLNTPMAQAPFKVGNLTENPALHYYAYLPLTFLLPLPFQALAEGTIGWFDQRFLHVFLFIAVLALAASLVTKPVHRLIVTMILGLNPLFVSYLIEGRNDVVTLFWIVLTVALLLKRRVMASAIVFAVACATKHTAWFFAPFYFVYISGAGLFAERLARIRRPLIAFVVVWALIMLPWIVWDAGAFFEDTFGALMGVTQYGAPIEGLGFGGWLLSLGIVTSPAAPFDFWIFQLITCVPLLAILLRRQWRANHIGTAVTGYGLLLFVFMFFSRLFNDNYVGFLVALLAVAGLMDRPDEHVMRETPCPNGGAEWGKT